MAQRPCSICEERAGDLLVTLTDNGATAYLCLVCAPAWLAEVWDMAGLPRLVFDVEEAENADLEPAPASPDGDVPAYHDAHMPPEPDGEPEPDAEPDDATPDDPGVLEMVERDDGKRAVTRADYRGRGGRGRPAKPGALVEANASPAADD